ncbi:hypothetical protein GOY07_02715 [Wolbachia endosymbiont of Litomosoides sigmodontis]|uniref:hypothetical protein n=1 Tax=Wolbachia endosymbiont of Litomosoides sigmodontis TaxID=80850 RepID=UPI00158944F7|nr:hypothetical protein [Wolbachia endosymbiont of Litomosoides sigmodontis]QKX03091.1 hypothetical protein GOY07_02715 [Wolbachia endosymbiont of Litomosoides sigmodontis]
MFANSKLPKKINQKWLIIGANSLLFMTMLPSIFLLAKMVIGLIMISVIAIAVKIASKTLLNVLEDKQADPNQSTPQTTQSRIVNLIVGLISTFAGGLSLLIIAKTGIAITCATVAILAIHEYTKDYKYAEDKEMSTSINDKFDDIAENITNFIVSSIEKFVPLQERHV